MCNPDLDPPEFKRSNCHTLLLDIDFAFLHGKIVNILLNMDDIFVWRRKYLRNVRQYRHKNRKIYYLDETWVNECHCSYKVWTDTTVGN